MHTTARSGTTLVWRKWSAFWFGEADCRPLEIVRIGIGVICAWQYGWLPQQDVLTLYGSNGLLLPEMIESPTHPTTFTALYFLREDGQVLVFIYGFAALSLAFAAGCLTRWIKWPLCIAFLSIFNRNELIVYGVDQVTLLLLVFLCLAPIGARWSFDSWWHNRLGGTATASQANWRASAVQRLIQVQMAIIFFSTGMDKLNGPAWRSGDAAWIALTDNEVALFPLAIASQHYWLVRLSSWITLLLEVLYPFLIWSRHSRLPMLSLAIGLHLAIALVFGMYHFSAVMICGHLAFVRGEWLTNKKPLVPLTPGV